MIYEYLTQIIIWFHILFGFHFIAASLQPGQSNITAEATRKQLNSTAYKPDIIFEIISALGDVFV